MNNQVNNFDQMSQLENIARVKQFMRKGSVKLLMIVSFLQAVFIMVGSAMLGGLIEPLFKTLMEFMTKYGAREGIVMPYDLSKLDATAFSSLSSSIVLSGVISALIALILPATLLIIVIRASSSDPTVVPTGALTFLRVITIIQLVFAILGGLLYVIVGILAMVSGQSSGIISGVMYIVAGIILVHFCFCEYQFVSSVRTSCNGYTFSQAGAKGVSVYSVLSAILNGLGMAIMIFVAVIFSSMSKGADIDESNPFSLLTKAGFFDIITVYMVVILIGVFLDLLYSCALAATSMGYTNMVTAMIRASFAASNNAAQNANMKSFRTYGGGSLYSNYNYSNGGQPQQPQQNDAPPMPPQNNSSAPVQGINLNKDNDNPYNNSSNFNNTPGNGSF